VLVGTEFGGLVSFSLLLSLVDRRSIVAASRLFSNRLGRAEGLGGRSVRKGLSGNGWHAPFIVSTLSSSSSFEEPLPLLCHLEGDHDVLGGVDSELSSVFLVLGVSPSIHVGDYPLSDLLSLMLEVLHNLDVGVHAVNLVYDVLELLASLLVNTIINCRL